jgi:hypothetical protein
MRLTTVPCVASGLKVIHFQRFHRRPVTHPVARKRSGPLLAPSAERTLANARSGASPGQPLPGEG